MECNHNEIYIGKTSNTFPKHRLCTCKCGYKYTQVQCDIEGRMIQNKEEEKMLDNKGGTHWIIAREYYV